MKWRFFAGAAILVGYCMLVAGAPLGTIVLGILLSAAFNLIQRHRNSGRA
jgi:hypothetical protein